jgi:hypothetical protein
VLGLPPQNERRRFAIVRTSANTFAFLSAGKSRFSFAAFLNLLLSLPPGRIPADLLFCEPPLAEFAANEISIAKPRTKKYVATASFRAKVPR